MSITPILDAQRQTTFLYLFHYPKHSSVWLLDDMATNVHEVMKDKGFWEGDLNIHKRTMLIISELVEALEDLRNKPEVREPLWKCMDHVFNAFDAYGPSSKEYIVAYRTHLKDRWESEIAGTCIRLFDMLGWAYSATGQKNIYDEDGRPAGSVVKIPSDIYELMTNVSTLLLNAVTNAKDGVDKALERGMVEACTDAVLIIEKWAEQTLLPIHSLVSYEMMYNLSRPHKHGKAF